MSAVGVGSQPVNGVNESGLVVGVAADGTTSVDRLLVTPGTVALELLQSGGAPAAKPVSVSAVLAADGYGLVVRGTIMGEGMIVGAFDGTDLALADEDGTLLPILPAEGEPTMEVSAPDSYDPGALQSPEARYFYARNGRHVWRYDLETRSANVVATAPSGERLEKFGAAAGGHLVIKTRIDSPYQEKIYWIKPGGATVPLNAAGLDMGYAFSLPEGIVAATTVLKVNTSGGLDAIRSGYVKFGTSAAAWSVPTGKTGPWRTSPVYAIDYDGLRMAQNPFLLIESSAGYPGSSQNQLLIDAANGYAFDGNNVVRLVDGAGGVEVAHHRNIVTDATTNDVVVALYGPQQGFDGDWGALVHRRVDASTGSYALGFVDPATGRLRAGEIYDFDGVVNGFMFDMTSVYKVGGDYVLLAAAANVGVRKLTLTSAGGTKRATWSATILGGAYVYAHRYAAVSGGKLYFAPFVATGMTDYRSIMRYDPATDDVEAWDSGMVPAGLAGIADFKCTAATTFAPLLGVFALPGAAGPAVLARTCSEVGGSGKLLLLRYAAWSMSAAPTSVTELPVLETDLDSTSVNSSRTLLAAPLPGGSSLALGVAATSKVSVVALADGAATTRSMADIKVQGRMEFASLFKGTQIFGEYYPEQQIDAKTSNVLPWGPDHLLVTVRDDAPIRRRSYRVTIASRAVAEVTALRGYSITSGTGLPGGAIFLSAYKLQDDTAQAVRLTVTPAGEVVEAADTTRIEALTPIPP